MILHHVLAFAAPVAGFLAMLVVPMVRAFTSKLIPQEEQGKVHAHVHVYMLIAVITGTFPYTITNMTIF